MAAPLGREVDSTPSCFDVPLVGVGETGGRDHVSIAVELRPGCVADLIQQMLDEALVALFGLETPANCWAQMIRPDDVVGIKTNVWRYLPTPPEGGLIRE